MELDDNTRLTFERFDAGHPDWGCKSETPLAGTSKGSIRFNKAAKEAFGLSSKSWVTVYYSKENKAIGLKKVEPGTSGSVKFYDMKSENNPCVGIPKAMDHFGIDKVRQNRLPVTFDKLTGLILVHGVRPRVTDGGTRNETAQSLVSRKASPKTQNNTVERHSHIDPDKAYTIEMIAAAVGVSKSTINNMRKNGLPSRKFGRRILVIGQDYLNYQKP